MATPNTPTHQKHAALARPNFGNYARTAFALVGAPCAEIRTLVNALVVALGAQRRVGYLDASHAEQLPNLAAHSEATQHADYQRFETHQTLTEYQYRTLFNDVDLLLVNGNHHAEKRQIVCLDPRKYDSLQRYRAAALSDVCLFLRTTKNQTIPDFLQATVADWQHIPILDLSDIAHIAEWLCLQTPPPLLKGLVLAGGYSTRMGSDKGTIAYHRQQAQREYVADLLTACGIEPYISLRSAQVETLPAPYEPLVDTFVELGPMGAILSAFRAQPNVAWLVVACDLPLVDAATFARLREHRQPSAVATAFRQPDGIFPEPLLTIYEPKAYATLLQFMAQGIVCPRKVLINSDTHLVTLPQAETILLNVNTPTDWQWTEK